MEVLQSGEEKKKIKSAAESAAEFLKNRLYGSHIPRETSEYEFKMYLTFIITGLSTLLGSGNISYSPFVYHVCNVSSKFLKIFQ